MPPRTSATVETTGVLDECDVETIDGGLDKNVTELKHANDRKVQLVWRNIIIFGYVHLAAVYGAYLALTSAKLYTIAFAYVMYVISGWGITAGAHRLWAHRSYKARLPLKILLTIFNTIAFQDCAIQWARDHRVHHKYSETDADPHNATRGFFFAHVGWLLCKKHPEVISKGKGLDLSDLENDPVLRFQKKHYMILMPIACFIVPTLIPVFLWGETWTNAWFVATMFRWTFVLNATWLVNSAAHLYGNHPYDKHINPSENKTVAYLALGEGWHNYHHTFPWDYKTAELGDYSANFTTAFIDFMAKIGLAYDLKTVSADTIQKRVERTGDGSHATWGWGDKDQSSVERNEAVITHQKQN